MFRDLFPRLASSYRLIAPDLPGFGFTEVPAGRGYRYSFDNFGGDGRGLRRGARLEALRALYF